MRQARRDDCHSILPVEGRGRAGGWPGFPVTLRLLRLTGLPSPPTATPAW